MEDRISKLKEQYLEGLITLDELVAEVIGQSLMDGCQCGDEEWVYVVVDFFKDNEPVAAFENYEDAESFGDEGMDAPRIYPVRSFRAGVKPVEYAHLLYEGDLLAQKLEATT